MHQYLIDTQYAASNLIDLIMHDERELETANTEYSKVKQDLDVYQNQFYGAEMSDDLSPMQLQHEYLQYYQRTERLNEREKQLIAHMESFKNLIDAKSFAVSSLCGALLQISKQGISIVHKGLGNCPNGREIGGEVLKNIIWQGRNQSMHYEENRFSSSVVNCFKNLETSFSDLSLTSHPNENFAQKIVIQVLGWNEYQVYERDMISLLG